MDEEMVILLPEFAKLMSGALQSFCNLLDMTGQPEEADKINQMATLLDDAIDAAANRN